MKIAIVNQKGGSGKSTTAVLLAKAAALEGKTVVLVDLDPQGGSTTLFKAKGKPGVFELLSQELEPVDVLQSCEGWERLHVIGADYRLDQLFISADPFVLQGWQIEADTIVFDTPPTLQGLTRSAIIAADRVLIPSEVSETALGPTVYTVETVRKLKKTPEVLLSGFKPANELKGTAAVLSARWIESIGQHIAGTIPRTLSAAKAATEGGKWTGKIRETIGHPLLAFTGDRP